MEIFNNQFNKFKKYVKLIFLVFFYCSNNIIFFKPQILHI